MWRCRCWDHNNTSEHQHPILNRGKANKLPTYQRVCFPPVFLSLSLSLRSERVGACFSTARQISGDAVATRGQLRAFSESTTDSVSRDASTRTHAGSGQRGVSFLRCGVVSVTMELCCRYGDPIVPHRAIHSYRNRTDETLGLESQ